MDKLADSQIACLRLLCSGSIQENVQLSTISKWKIGGNASLLIKPATTSEVACLMKYFAACNICPIIIGGASNILFDDAGLRTPIIQISSNISHCAISGEFVSVEAGAFTPWIARKIMLSGLGGGEHICGIPGTIGGLVFMNGGSGRKGIEENVVSVDSVDRLGKIHTRTVTECGFLYRRSVFQINKEVIVSVRFKFNPRPLSEVRCDMLRILAERRLKFPQGMPNCGSVFQSNPLLYADHGSPGKIIEKIGLKGFNIGGAEVSSKHANFIVNTGDAKASDVLKLIRYIQNRVQLEIGINLQPEVRYVSDHTVEEI